MNFLERGHAHVRVGAPLYDGEGFDVRVLEQDETSYLIAQLQQAFPGTSGKRLANTVNEFGDQAVPLGLLGGLGLIWSSIGLFSALESAMNIVYGLRNRTFAHGKTLMFVLVAGSIALMFAALGIGSLGVGVLLTLGGAGLELLQQLLHARQLAVQLGLGLVQPVLHLLDGRACGLAAVLRGGWGVGVGLLGAGCDDEEQGDEVHGAPGG